MPEHKTEINPSQPQPLVSSALAAVPPASGFEALRAGHEQTGETVPDQAANKGLLAFMSPSQSIVAVILFECGPVLVHASNVNQ